MLENGAPPKNEENEKTAVFRMSDSKIHFLAGGVAGAVGAICTCPLEVVKTRLQAIHNKEFLTISTRGRSFGLGVVLTLRDIAKQEGVTGLWKGIGPGLVGVAPARAIWFSTYNTTKRTIEDHFGTFNSKIHFISAIFAGITVATITSPIWLVKTRMQLQTVMQNNASEYNYKNSLDCVRRVYKEEGVRGFYKGLGASYLGVTESSLQMVFYEKIKETVQKKKYCSSSSPNNTEYRNIKLEAGDQFIVGSIAKLIAAVLTYPHEVIRTRMREQRDANGVTSKYRNIFQGLSLIAKEEGRMGLYGGLAPHLLKVVPNAAIMFYIYEYVVDYLSK